MAYTTAADVKIYLGIPSATTTDDTLIGSLITRAQKIIEEYTGRLFEAATLTKYFTIDDIDGQYLYLYHDDLLTVTTLTNGDGDTIASANFRLEPMNSNPKWAIRLDKDTDWEFTDSDSRITVAGTWAYTATAPYDIVHACIRLVSFLYRQKDTAADVDRPMMTGDGVTIMPSQLPKDVQMILDKYRRRI